jgi:hypothetical protein
MFSHGSMFFDIFELIIGRMDETYPLRKLLHLLNRHKPGTILRRFTKNNVGAFDERDFIVR